MKVVAPLCDWNWFADPLCSPAETTHDSCCKTNRKAPWGLLLCPLARSGAQEPKGWPGSTLFPENSYPSHGPRGALRASFLNKTSFIDNRGGRCEFRENILFSFDWGQIFNCGMFFSLSGHFFLIEG